MRLKKQQNLGAKVVACSDSNGYVYDENGIDLETVKQIKEVERKRISEYVNDIQTLITTKAVKNIWLIPCDIALPCATQNEIDEYQRKS